MLPAGTSLGPYKILAPLGAGCMGEVYRAHDARLGRNVAWRKIAWLELRGGIVMKIRVAVLPAILIVACSGVPHRTAEWASSTISSYEVGKTRESDFRTDWQGKQRKSDARDYQVLWVNREETAQGTKVTYELGHSIHVGYVQAKYATRRSSPKVNPPVTAAPESEMAGGSSTVMTPELLPWDAASTRWILVFVNGVLDSLYTLAENDSERPTDLPDSHE